MKRFLKITLCVFVLLIASIAIYDFWNMKFNYNFGTITEDRVYKSGAMDPERITETIKEHGIKTVIDLRNENSKRFTPAEEKAVLDQISGVNYINIKSRQVPSEETLSDFYKILDDESNYPVLIHCYHGLGRTMIYSALYRIEYENMDNEEAREKTRPYPVESAVYDSQFASYKAKGKFLVEYIPRRLRETLTPDTEVNDK